MERLIFFLDIFFFLRERTVVWFNYGYVKGYVFVQDSVYQFSCLVLRPVVVANGNRTVALDGASCISLFL